VFSVCCVFTGCRLVTAPNVVDSAASMFHDTGPHWLAPISQLTSQSSLKGYSSRPHFLSADSRLPADPLTVSELTNCLSRLDSSLSSLALLGSGSRRRTCLCLPARVLAGWRPSHADLCLLASAGAFLQLLAPGRSPTAVSRLTHSKSTHGDESIAR
jgi:hypothetical protein